MTKYIDADALAKRFVPKQAYFTEHILEKIKTAPMVDAIRVVRCADCICWEAPSAIEKQDGSTMGHCRNHYGACANEQTDASWFCADGERVER